MLQLAFRTVNLPGPYSVYWLRHAPLFPHADVPLPPDLARAGPKGTLGGERVTVTLPPGGQHRTGVIHTGVRRICGRRAVALGQKPLLVGGAAEGNAFRHFAKE
jgi:hypothetical protein